MISNENLAKKNWQLKEYGLNLIGKKKTKEGEIVK
jgi:hypothetical protein